MTVERREWQNSGPDSTNCPGRVRVRRRECVDDISGVDRL